jgi:hypothetical protein
MSVHHVTLFDSWPHLSALMPPARPPGRCSRGSGIDCALPSRAPPAPSISAPPPTARAAARAAPSGRRHCPRTPARTRITATDVRGHPTSRRRCAFPTSPPPSLPLPPSPPLSLTADSDVPAGLFANTVLRRSVRECLLHQQFQIIHHSK